MLTKLQALELCEKLWRWLSNHPDAKKHEWPKWDNHPRFNFYDVIYGKKVIENSCFACQYHKDRHPRWKTIITPNCIKGCILKGLWPEGCVYGNSPYAIWEKGQDKRKHARIIADFCKAEIKKLKIRKSR